MEAQGVTTEQVYVLAGNEMTHRELAYVDASRARGTTRIFTEQADAGETLTSLARRMSKSRAKDLAHDVMKPPVAPPDLGLDIPM